jgi:hypothetical protein
LFLLGAIPAAWFGIRFVLRSIRKGAHFYVQAEAAFKLILYELVPNNDDSIKDKTDRAVQLGEHAVRLVEENQRALENHLQLDHPYGGRVAPATDTPAGTPEGF